MILCQYLCSYLHQKGVMFQGRDRGTFKGSNLSLKPNFNILRDDVSAGNTYLEICVAVKQ